MKTSTFARIELFALAASALALAACSGDEPLPTVPAVVHEAHVDPGETRRGHGDRPRHVRPMRIRATVELVGPVAQPLPECVIMHVSSVILGRASHLGRFEGTGSTCIESFTPDPSPPFLPPAPPPYATARFSNPRWVLTGRNGDELWLEARNAIAVLAVNPSDGSARALRAEGSHTIVGGTGRFRGATGELASAAINYDGQGPDQFRSRGWIRLCRRGEWNGRVEGPGTQTSEDNACRPRRDR